MSLRPHSSLPCPTAGHSGFWSCGVVLLYLEHCLSFSFSFEPELFAPFGSKAADPCWEPRGSPRPTAAGWAQGGTARSPPVPLSPAPSCGPHPAAPPRPPGTLQHPIPTATHPVPMATSPPAPQGCPSSPPRVPLLVPPIATTAPSPAQAGTCVCRALRDSSDTARPKSELQLRRCPTARRRRGRGGTQGGGTGAACPICGSSAALGAPCAQSCALSSGTA